MLIWLNHKNLKKQFKVNQMVLNIVHHKCKVISIFLLIKKDGDVQCKMLIFMKLILEMVMLYLLYLMDMEVLFLY